MRSQRVVLCTRSQRQLKEWKLLDHAVSTRRCWSPTKVEELRRPSLGPSRVLLQEEAARGGAEVGVGWRGGPLGAGSLLQHGVGVVEKLLEGLIAWLGSPRWLVVAWWHVVTSVVSGPPRWLGAISLSILVTSISCGHLGGLGLSQYLVVGPNLMAWGHLGGLGSPRWPPRWAGVILVLGVTSLPWGHLIVLGVTLVATLMGWGHLLGLGSPPCPGGHLLSLGSPRCLGGHLLGSGTPWWLGDIFVLPWNLGVTS